MIVIVETTTSSAGGVYSGVTWEIFFRASPGVMVVCFVATELSPAAVVVRTVWTTVVVDIGYEFSVSWVGLR